MVEPGEIEIACPACGHNTVFHFSRIELEGDFVCAGCAQSLAGETKQISRAIAQIQKGLNATIRGLKRNRS